jgi:hypothetical protein
MTNDARLEIRLPAAVKARLVAEAKRQDVSLGRYMRAVVWANLPQLTIEDLLPGVDTQAEMRKLYTEAQERRFTEALEAVRESAARTLLYRGFGEAPDA